MFYTSRDCDIDRLGTKLLNRQGITQEELLDICEALNIPIHNPDNTPRFLGAIYTDLCKIRPILPMTAIFVSEALDTISKLIASGQIKIKTEEELLCESEELNIFLDTFKIL